MIPISDLKRIRDEYIKKYLNTLDFQLVEGADSLWHKIYIDFDYEIKIDLNQSEIGRCKILYGDLIKRGRETTKKLFLLVFQDIQIILIPT